MVIGDDVRRSDGPVTGGAGHLEPLAEACAPVARQVVEMAEARFGAGSYFITAVSFPKKEGIRRQVRAFLNQVRRMQNDKGADGGRLEYIIAIEPDDQTGHMLLNAEGLTLDEIRAAGDCLGFAIIGTLDGKEREVERRLRFMAIKCKGRLIIPHTLSGGPGQDDEWEA